jgi:cyclohexane-1-carbonyl-CoA dehydrogenase
LHEITKPVPLELPERNGASESDLSIADFRDQPIPFSGAGSHVDLLSGFKRVRGEKGYFVGLHPNALPAKSLSVLDRFSSIVLSNMADSIIGRNGILHAVRPPPGVKGGVFRVNRVNSWFSGKDNYVTSEDLGMGELTKEQEILLAAIQRAVREKVAPSASETDRTGVFNWETVSLFWDLGLLQIMLPEEYGGWPENPCCTLCHSIEEIAKVCASSSLNLIIQAVGSFPLIHAGTEKQKKRFFPMISEGRKLIGYLVTEPNAGSDVAAIATTAEKRGSNYVLNGRKTFATNGGVAGLYSVLARTGNRKLSFFILERDRKGVSIGKTEDKCGFRGSNTAEVILEEVEVPEENLLGNPGEGFLIAMADFDMSRPAVAALAMGIAEGALDYAVGYARQRRTFGKPLIEHQAIQFMLADGLTLIEAGRGLMERAALAYDMGRRNTALASMAKSFCSDAAMKITTDMLQVLGGYGYIKDFPVERMFRDAKLTQIFEGSNQIQKMIIGREIMKRGLLAV